MTESVELPTIVAFVADLYFSSRIASAAERVNFQVEWIESAAQLGPPEPDGLRLRFGEHLTGPGAQLIDRITQWQPVLLLFDLNNNAVPWKEWIELLTSVSATRRIPVLCYGSHRDIEALKAAKTAGANAVLARSRFVTELPELLQKYARLPDRAALVAACSQPLAPEAGRGLEAFNRGEYFEAHELLEAAWLADEGPGRDLYQAILQLAVAYYHIQRGNYNGALKMFLRLRQWLDPLPETCRGVDVARLQEAARRAHAALQALGPQQIEAFDPGLFEPVFYQLSG